MSVMLLELSPVRASDDVTNSILYGCPAVIVWHALAPCITVPALLELHPT